MVLQVVKGLDAAVLRVVIYARVSEDRRGGASVAEQIEEGHLDLAELGEKEGRDIEIVAVESDNDVGASEYSRGTRTGWPRVLQMMRSRQVDMLWTWEHSRGDRKLDGYLDIRNACMSAKVLWRYGGTTYDMSDWRDRERTGADAVKAEAESGQTSERVSRSTRRAAAKGRPHGRRLYGYRRVHDEATGRLTHQEPHPDEAWVVAWIYDQYLAGVPVHRIHRCLNAVALLMVAAHVVVGHELGAPLRPVTAHKGSGPIEQRRQRHPWSGHRIRKILCNPAYKGVRRWKGKEIDTGGWPEIVTPERWQAAQDRLNQRSGARQNGTARLLTGVARAGPCAGTMGVVKWSRGRDYRVYRCLTDWCIARDMERLDDWVTERLLARLARPDIADLMAGTEDPAVAAAREHRAELKEELDKAWELWDAGKLSIERYAEVEQKRSREIGELDRQIRRASIPLDIDIPPPDQLPEWWVNDLTPELRREVVATFISAVVVYPVGRGKRKYDDADYTEIRWRGE